MGMGGVLSHGFSKLNLKYFWSYNLSSMDSHQIIDICRRTDGRTDVVWSAFIPSFTKLFSTIWHHVTMFIITFMSVVRDQQLLSARELFYSSFIHTAFRLSEIRFDPWVNFWSIKVILSHSVWSTIGSCSLCSLYSILPILQTGAFSINTMKYKQYWWDKY